jgi:serine phosphatase RsbU (regulator of sigma subunit)/anti-sigma regulatory factor (Ser/Thr protein kinase)
MDKATNGANTTRTRLISMRLIVTAASVVLIAAAVFTVAGVAERNVRRTLTRELETRLVLEARNLALVGSSALLSEFPELTLHPVVKKMTSERPELEMVYVVDLDGIVQGHAEAERLGTHWSIDPTLQPVKPAASLDEAETLLGNDKLLVVRRDVHHPNGETIGAVVVGIGRRHAEASLMAARKQQLLVLLPVLGAAVLLTMILMSRLLRPISVLRGGLEKIGTGHLDARVQLKSRTELDLLANSINDMAAALEVAQKERFEKERLAHEMELAREIQRSLLPESSFRAGDVVVAGAQDAAAEVGGDYYDVFPLPDARVGVVVADVAGKGLAGCLVTSMIAVLVRTMRAYFESPARLLVRLEESLAGSLRPGTFVTVFYGILDTEREALTFASAAHNPLLHYNARDKSVEWHRTRGVPVGMARGGALAASLVDETIRLGSGDAVLVFTDGLNEAVNGSLEEYGFDRIERAVRSLAPRGGDEIVSGLRRAVTRWESGRAAEDDKTVVVIQRALSGAVVESTTCAQRGPTRLQRLMARRGDACHLTIAATLEGLDDVHEWLRGCDGLSTLPREDMTMVEHGVYEILANIAEHGCGLDGGKTIDVWWIADDAGPDGCFLIRDHGQSPRPEQWKWREPEGADSLRRGRGYGLAIIRETLSEVEFHADTQDGNITLARYETPRPRNLVDNHPDSI